MVPIVQGSVSPGGGEPWVYAEQADPQPRPVRSAVDEPPAPDDAERGARTDDQRPLSHDPGGARDQAAHDQHGSASGQPPAPAPRPW